MVKWTLLVVVGLTALVAAVALVGTFLPKQHRASRTMVYNAPPSAVYAAITDFAKFPEWRSGVKRVDILPSSDGRIRFREEGPHGPMIYKVETQEPGAKLVTRLDDPSQPFGGTWTLELKAADGGTALTITEDGEIYNPMFRVMSKVFFSPYDTIDRYQADLKKRL